MKTPTAAILVIGNEILSGRTQDANIAFIATRLAARGIKLCEVRIVRDEEEAIIAAVKALSLTYDCIFSTGGIGPTHDDITAECMAKAFDAAIEMSESARKTLADYCAARNVPLNEGRLRMARVPKGAVLIANEVSAAPGFKIANVYVMAGVPKIMQAMFLAIEDGLPQGQPVLSVTVSCSLREGDIADALEKIQNRHPETEIGSYPHMPGLSLVVRGVNAEKVEAARAEIEAMVKKYGQNHN